MPWKILQASSMGFGHQECQDYHRVGQSNGSLIAIVCDGAGSAQFSLRGAKKAADYLFEALQGEFPDVEGLKKKIEEAKEALVQEACGEPLSAFATTLLGAVVNEEEALFFQIGDGAIVAWNGGFGSVVFWPRSYEYANQTAFLTDEQLDVQIRTLKGIKEVALFTDGLQGLALEYASKSVYENFFAPFRECLAAVKEPSLVNPLVQAFLDSPAVNRRTHDDKTLIVARYEST